MAEFQWLKIKGNLDIRTTGYQSPEGDSCTPAEAICYKDSENLFSLLDMFYPVGSIYIAHTTTTICPIQSKLGGTWSEIKRGSGSSANGYLLYYTNESGEAGARGGFAKPVQVKHTHAYTDERANGKETSYLANYSNYPIALYSNGLSWRDSFYAGASIPSMSFLNDVTNYPPYLCVRMWKRTA